MARSEKLYKDSPRIERDGESGKPQVAKGPKEKTKGPTKEEQVADGTDGVQVMHATERREMHHRHIGEHMALHNRHEAEHATGGDLHEKHAAEHKEMQTRHHREFVAMQARHGEKE